MFYWYRACSSYKYYWLFLFIYYYFLLFYNLHYSLREHWTVSVIAIYNFKKIYSYLLFRTANNLTLMVIFRNWFILQRLSQRLCEGTNEGQRKEKKFKNKIFNRKVCVCFHVVIGALRGVGTYDWLLGISHHRKHSCVVKLWILNSGKHARFAVRYPCLLARVKDPK